MPEKKTIELLPKNEKYTIGTNNNLNYVRISNLKFSQDNNIKGNINGNLST